MRVTGPRGVVPHHRRFDLGHGHLHLATRRTDPSGRVLGNRSDDLLRSAGLGRVECLGDRRVERGGKGPGLGSVDHDLDEPQCPGVRPQSAFRLTGLNVEAGHPLLVGLTGEAPGVPHTAL